ncbi:LysR family transcriptional regulator [Chondromyces apiculatus]|uniref:LysR family transcriptional regulator n=1 Tax=Chondromyces apiculatus DSM 436 TaxID=1192034 RepID=A0A017T0J2_9BACT|nr:LysR family transcriptional regulator [Chondromyces apiculatus]EYF02748.1 LysR family transcriptional regulator [Chondromyces apiculatus DSM 436]
MEFRQLQLFVAVAEELHFGRAAARVGMAQPPFSQQILRLEEELGVKLLSRTSRRVALTAAGAQLLDDARGLLARRTDLIASARRASRGEIGRLRVGFAASSAFGILAPVVRSFRARFPEVSLHLDEYEMPGLGAALATGELDVAVVRAPFQQEGVAVEELLRERFVVALSTLHPRAHEKALPLSSLSPEPFVLFPRHTGPGMHDTIVGMCTRAGFSPRIVQEASSWSSVISLVAAGMGITLAPRSARILRPRSVVFRQVRGARGWATLAMAYRVEEPSPIAAHFRAIAHATVAGTEPVTPGAG